MKCLVPSQNVKIIARSVNSLSKIGDEVFIECSEEGLILRTVNIAQSAFAEFRLFRSFFTVYIFSEEDERDFGCKVTMKSFLSVFKNPHSMDKQVESCEIKMKPTANVVVFQIKYTNSYVRKFYLPIIEHEKLETVVPTNLPNGLTVSSKFLMSAVKNFRHSEDEVTFNVEKDRTFIKNHVELVRKENFMRTELCFHPTEFENYSITNPTSVTFCFKELRAVLAFAEPSGLPVICTFSDPGRPILFRVENHPAYEASYVVSTLNSTNDNLHSSLVESQKSTSFSRNPGTSDAVRPTKRTSEALYEFTDERDHDSSRIEEQMSMDVDPQPTLIRNQSHTNLNASVVPSSRFHEMDVRQLTNHSTNFPSRIEESEAGSSVHSSYGSTSEAFNNASPLTMSHSSFPLTSTSVANHMDKETEELMKIVFARCYAGNVNLIDSIQKNKLILANDSDTEQV